MSAYLVTTFAHLNDMPQSEVALALLQRVASLVKPIMKKRSWVLPVLAEFYPSNPALQGVCAV
jgi:DNA-dependent metalloprotease WSS1